MPFGPHVRSLMFFSSLELIYYDKILYPCELSLPSSLGKLTFIEVSPTLPWDAISAVGKLPNLEVLKLLHRAFEGQQWDMRDGEFLKLKFLKLDALNIVHWDASGDNFPCLEQLAMRSCKQIEKIPSSFGDILSLQKIEVQWCSISASNSAKEIQVEQPDMGNDCLKILIIHHPDFDPRSAP